MIESAFVRSIFSSSPQPNLYLPKSLFKYREFDSNGYAVENLRNDVLWLSSAGEFNDPMDSFFYISPAALEKKAWNESTKEKLKKRAEFLGESSIVTVDDVEKAPSLACLMDKAKGVTPGLYAALENNWSEIYEKFWIDDFRRKVQSGMKVCSLSASNVSTLMWRYYAANHSGFCIEYDFIETREKDSQLAHMVYPVCYVQEIPDLTALFLGDNFSTAVVAALYKSDEWSYEKEWRFIFPGRMPENGFEMRAPKIKAMYLGMAISDENKRAILDIAKRKRVDVYVMHLKTMSYRLGFKKIDL